MMFLTHGIKFLLNTIIRKEIMNAYHKLVLILFYAIFSLIFILKRNELCRMSPIYTILLFISVFIVTVLTITKNKKYIEEFEESIQGTSLTTGIGAQVSSDTAQVPVSDTSQVSSDTAQVPVSDTSQVSSDTAQVSSETAQVSETAGTRALGSTALTNGIGARVSETTTPVQVTNPIGGGTLTLSDIDRSIIVNEDHNDMLLSQTGFTSFQVVFYYSCFQYKSIDFIKNEWKSIMDNNDKITIKTSDNLFSKYKQKEGFNLSENVMIEGLKSDTLKMGNYRMKQFTLFMYVKINLSSGDFNTYNIFELYSSNIDGNIAFCMKIENKNLKFVYGGIDLTPDAGISLNSYIGSEEPFLITVVKSNIDSNHKLSIYINNENTPTHEIDNIDYSSISYISGNRNYIELSKERFIINKHLDQPHGGLNMQLLNFGMFNKALNVDEVKLIYNNLEDQRINQLNISVIDTNNKLALQQDTINELEAELQRINACKLSPEVCGQCVGIDTSRFSSIQQDLKCYSAFRNKCELIKKDSMYNNNTEEDDLCRFLSPVVIETASNCVSDNSDQAKKMKSISLDRVSREDSNTPKNNTITDIKYNDLYKPVENPTEIINEEDADETPIVNEEETKETKITKESPTKNKPGLIKDFVDGKMSKDELYKNIMDDYQKDLENKIDMEEEEIEKDTSNPFIDFIKYFFFIK